MPNRIPTTLSQAAYTRHLEAAVAAHFCHLFAVLCSDGEKPGSLDRFEHGLAILRGSELEVARLIQESIDV
jgi:hypothetical protein